MPRKKKTFIEEFEEMLEQRKEMIDQYNGQYLDQMVADGWSAQDASAIYDALITLKSNSEMNKLNEDQKKCIESETDTTMEDFHGRPEHD